MNKSLLTLMAAGLTAVAATAGTDPATYAEAAGLTCTNLWNISRTVDGNEFNATRFGEFNNKTRSMIVVGDNMIIAQSRTVSTPGATADDPAVSDDFATLLFYELYTGKFVKAVDVTCGGEAIHGLLCFNQIGIDDFGNVWFCGLRGDSNTQPFKLYRIPDVNTGEAELVAEINVPDEEKTGDVVRHDYYDLVGDVTGQKAGTVLMTPAASAPGCWVYGFKREQGSDEWLPFMNGGSYTIGVIEETYPADQTTWNGAPMVSIVRDDEHSGNNYYIDAFVTCPALYDNEGTLLESFASNSDLAPAVGPNGCLEFDMGGRKFFIFVNCDYDGKTAGSQIAFTEVNAETGAFESMQSLWLIPAEGFGTISDSGTRSFGICPVIKTDKNGKNGCYLALSKCNGGMGTYLIAEPGFDRSEFDGAAGVNDIVADQTANDAPVEYFTPAGSRVSAAKLAPGLYITRQGAVTAKKIVK